MQIDISTVTLTDPHVVPDVFVSGLAVVDDLGGGCFRFTFFARQKTESGEEMIVVAKLIAPMEAVPPALLMAAKAIGLSLIAVPRFISGTVH